MSIDVLRSAFVAIFTATFILLACGKKEVSVSFNEDVRPIFVERCMKCHGGIRQLSDFSLLFREEALAKAKSGSHPIIPEDPENSSLLHRIRSSDPNQIMPPEGPPLSDREIGLIEKWIKEGARWERHWAYDKPIIGDKLADPSIDYFINERLAKLKVTPTAAAERQVLLRRLGLDVVGLPVSTLEIAGVEDMSYEAIVDLLLESPAYGEKWASFWLDLARYGDSMGYQKDNLRNIWRYRDWVIHALNENMPFDQFTIEQLAGDLLPAASEDQKLATAFHRNTNTNTEGGTDDEEFRLVAVMDRVNTTAETWLGSTMACVQCHSHPYDPIRHQEYFKMLAYFNNTKDNDANSEQPNLIALSPAQKKKKSEIEYFLASESNLDSRADLVSELKSILPGPTPVMEEFHPDSSRVTRVFERGNWLVQADTVLPAIPAAFNLGGRSVQGSRLDLAEWIMSSDNPVTSRVIVNRIWEQIFGIGLVETLEDFGTIGAKPSHPELLDWLALEFQGEMEWSLKKLIKTIVISESYRRSSEVNPELIDRDPQNRWLARGPRVRLSAEQIRDQALAVSGLLSKKMYGPSVMPPQPEGVWNVIRHVAKWVPSEGEDRYRRALYTFHRKSSPYPTQITFDGTSREFCVSRRIRTNTPLQALVTLNDPVYFEAAVALAKRMNSEASLGNKISIGYELAAGRSPDSLKLNSLVEFYKDTRQGYMNQPQLLDSLRLEYQAPDSDFGALINTANVILNLDDVLVKG